MKRFDAFCPLLGSLVILTMLLAWALLLPVEAAEAPAQLGNFFSFESFTATVTASANRGYPVLGRANVADNNSPIPTDRAYFFYNHYHNALDIAPGTLVERSASVDQYTVGAERTFADGLGSIDIRLPVFDAIATSIGNLSVINKCALYDESTFTLAAGLAITLPTGADTQLASPGGIATLKNQAVHLQPFLGYVATPTERSFWQGFAQIDIPLNSNRIEWATMPLTTNRITDQTVLFLNISTGYWLYRNRESDCLTGLAPIIELHYFTSLNDAKSAVLVNPMDAVDRIRFGNPGNNFDMLNLTFGIHSEFNNQTKLRVAGVVPLSRVDKFFDSEVQVSLIREY